MATIEQPKKRERWYVLRNEDLRNRIADWHASLHQSPGTRAALRRCATPAEAALVSVTFALARMLPKYASIEAAASMAGILAHVLPEGIADTQSLGKKLSLPRDRTTEGSPLYSETRFRQLLSARTWEEWYTDLRRAIMMLKGNVSPVVVADLILQWDRENRSESQVELKKSVKFDLSSDYYNTILKASKE